MTQQELQQRTLAFALAVYRFARPLFRDADTRHIAQQLARSSASVAANYRAACLARSPKEWRAKMGLVLEEADESCFWLEFALEAGPCGDHDQAGILLGEARQLAKIFGAACRTSRDRLRRDQCPRSPPRPIDR